MKYYLILHVLILNFDFQKLLSIRHFLIIYPLNFLRNQIYQYLIVNFSFSWQIVIKVNIIVVVIIIINAGIIIVPQFEIAKKIIKLYFIKVALMLHHYF